MCAGNGLQRLRPSICYAGTLWRQARGEKSQRTSSCDSDGSSTKTRERHSMARKQTDIGGTSSRDVAQPFFFVLLILNSSLGTAATSWLLPLMWKTFPRSRVEGLPGSAGMEHAPRC